MNYFRYLLPGLRIKRWLFLIALGFFIAGLGFSVIIKGSVFGRLEFLLQDYASWIGPYGHVYFGLLIIAAGLVVLWYSFRAAISSLIKSIFPEYKENPLKTAYHRNYLKRGPRTVVIGGGTGLSVLLRGLKEYTSNITAIVSVADDGGSSGRLRGEFGILPPGDLRNCLVALADTETEMEKLFNYRFTQGQELTGHSLGNLLITALADISGSFETAIDEASKVLAIRGRVLPSTLDNIMLGAQLQDGSMVMGESVISKTLKPINKVFLIPDHCRAMSEAIEAILEADAIILGPGSLYTSIIPNLLVPGIMEAITRSDAIKVYVCNIMTQPGETINYTAADHLNALHLHARPGLVKYMIVNNQEVPEYFRVKYSLEGAQAVEVDKDKLGKLQVEVLAASLLQEKDDLLRHDPDKLAHLIIQLILDKKGLKPFAGPFTKL